MMVSPASRPALKSLAVNGLSLPIAEPLAPRSARSRPAHTLAEASSNRRRKLIRVDEAHYVPGSAGDMLFRRRREFIGRLRTTYGDTACKTLADKLQACKRHNRCQSAACPECHAAAQTVITETVMRFLDRHPDRQRLVCVRATPPDDIRVFLRDRDHGRVASRSLERLGDAGIEWFIGGTDWSVSESKNWFVGGVDGSGGKMRRARPRWTRHFLGFTATDDATALEERLRAQFSSTAVITWPVDVRPWDGARLAVSLMLPGEFYRRTDADRAKRPGPIGEDRPGLFSNKLIRLKFQSELLVYLDRLGFEGRLLMHGLHLKEGGWEIVG